jgi:hypothetical protein
MNFGTQLYEFDLGLHQFEYTGHKCAHHDEGEREEAVVMPEMIAGGARGAAAVRRARRRQLCARDLRAATGGEPAVANWWRRWTAQLRRRRYGTGRRRVGEVARRRTSGGEKVREPADREDIYDRWVPQFLKAPDNPVEATESTG